MFDLTVIKTQLTGKNKPSAISGENQTLTGSLIRAAAGVPFRIEQIERNRLKYTDFLFFPDRIDMNSAVLHSRECFLYRLMHIFSDRVSFD